MPTPPEWGAVVAGAGVVGGVVVQVVNRFLSHGTDVATVEKLNADAKKTAQETAAAEVGYMREIIAEVRESAAEKTADLVRLKADMVAMKERMDLMEERERHQLSRASVHEGWTQLAFQTLLTQYPDWPPPPPLILEDEDNHHP